MHRNSFEEPIGGMGTVNRGAALKELARERGPLTSAR
jgi:hypothetical protein